MKLPAAPDPSDWRDSYDGLGAITCPICARPARALPFAGSAACVDVYLRLEDARPVARRTIPHSPAVALWPNELLATGAARGDRRRDARVEWPDGTRLAGQPHLPSKLGLGGTGAQAAQTLAVLGAPAVLALNHRSRPQLDLIDPAVRVATAEGLVPVGAVTVSGAGKPAHYIAEFTAGIPIVGIVPPRSSRIIIRFADDPLERDPWFETTRGCHELAAS